MTSKTFCIYPWIHQYVNPDGSVLPCCVADHHRHLGNVRSNTLEEIWNSEGYKNIRKKMLAGESCDECKGCYQQEQRGVESVRQSKNKKYKEFMHFADKTNDDGSLDKMELKHFDIRWSNICNFKCRSCSSTYSSTWAQEDKSQGKTKEIFIIAGGLSNDDLYTQIESQLPSIKTFYFAGGEPLLTDKHYDILQYLIDSGNTDVEIEYNTNLSRLEYKSKSVLDLWKHFSNISVNASLDSWGDRAEYIREGTIWSDVVSNIQRIKTETPYVRLSSGSVISVFNVFTVTDFLDYIFDNNLFDIKSYQPFFYNIINPNYYGAEIINQDLKNQIIDKIRSKSYNKNIDKELNKIVMYLENSVYNEQLRKQFILITDHYDKIRNRNFLKTFPELQGLYI